MAHSDVTSLVTTVLEEETFVVDISVRTAPFGHKGQGSVVVAVQAYKEWNIIFDKDGDTL